MLGKLKILMLLATIVPESLSGPTNATDLVPGNPGRSRSLAAALEQFEVSVEAFKRMERTTSLILGEAINKFSKKVMFNLQSEVNPRNLVFSGFSMHAAMMLCFYGSQGNTRTQLHAALELDDDEDDVEYLTNAFKLTNIYGKPNTGFEMANNLFLAEKFSIKINSPYQRMMYAFYGARSSRLDSDSALAREHINQYVREKTHGLIPSLMSPGSISQSADVVAINAIFHKDNWKIQFDKARTGPMDFKLLDGTTIIYPHGMRVKSNELEFFFTHEFRALALPYQNPDFVMYVVMPEKNTLAALNEQARKFDPSKLGKQLVKDKDCGVDVVMPRFALSLKMEMSQTMQAMGVVDLFDASKVDLRPLTGMSGIAISQAAHQSLIQVNEEGSQAAAATSVIMCTRAIGPAKVSIDGAFNFFVVDRTRNIVLISGMVVDPSENQDPLPGYPNPSI